MSILFIEDEISVNSLELTQLDYALFIRRFGPLQLCLKKVSASYLTYESLTRLCFLKKTD